MEFLELPFEAIALRFHVATAVAWLAVAAAAVGLWRIRAVGSRSDASSSLSAPSSLAPSPETEPSRPVRADPAPTQPSRIRPCAAPKERFTANYGDDASYGDEEEAEEEEEEEEEEHVGVDGEMTAPLVGVRIVWVVNGDVRRGIYEPCPLLLLPPSDLQVRLGQLLDSREGTDVSFEVGWETFAAHPWLIAA